MPLRYPTRGFVPGIPATMMKKRKTNVEQIVELMNFARSGPLMQAFVLEAIIQYSEALKRDTSEPDPESPVNMRAWKACANEAHATLTAFLGGALDRDVPDEGTAIEIAQSTAGENQC